MLAYRFASGGSASVEYTEDALDEEQAGRGAWLDVLTDDPAALLHKALAAGPTRVEYATGHFYVRAPGGQVWGIRTA